MVTKERNFNSFLNAYVPVGTVITTLDNGTTVFYFPDGTFKQLSNNEPAMYSIASSSVAETDDPEFLITFTLFIRHTRCGFSLVWKEKATHLRASILKRP